MITSRAAALEIGDPMPDPWTMSDLMMHPQITTWQLEDGTMGGWTYMFGTPELGIKFVGTSRVCGDKELYPMGVYSYEEDTLYLDINPHDGKIDKIVKDLSKLDDNASDKKVNANICDCPEQ